MEGSSSIKLITRRVEQSWRWKQQTLHHTTWGKFTIGPSASILKTLPHSHWGMPCRDSAPSCISYVAFSETPKDVMQRFHPKGNDFIPLPLPHDRDTHVGICRKPVRHLHTVHTCTVRVSTYMYIVSTWKFYSALMQL